MLRVTIEFGLTNEESVACVMRYPLFLLFRDVPDLAIDYQCVVFGIEEIQQWPHETANVFAVTGPRQPIEIGFSRYCDSIISPFRDVDPAIEDRKRMSERMKQAWLSCIGSELVSIDCKIGPTLWASIEQQDLTVANFQCEARLGIRHPAEFQYAVRHTNYVGITELNDDELMATRAFRFGDRIPCYLQNGCGLLELIEPLASSGAFHCHLQVCSDEQLEGQLPQKHFAYTSRMNGKLPRVFAELTNLWPHD